MKAITNEKAISGIRTFLERRGIEVKEEGWAHDNDSIDFIADDEGDLVFIDCNVSDNDGHGFGEDSFDRDAFERIATAYLSEHQELPDGEVRLDIISMLVLAEGKGLLRHHRNALSVTG